MEPVDEPLPPIVEDQPETLRAEIEARQGLLRTLPPAFPGLLCEPPDQETREKVLGIEVEIAMLRNRLDWLERRKPIYDAGYQAGKSAEKRKGAWAANRPWTTSRYLCVQWAAEIWADNPKRRIGEVAEALFEKLIKESRIAPEQSSKVADWLRQAAKEGKLTIPPEAQKGGRPRKSRNPPTR